MSFALHGSEKYVWFTGESNVLGKGATGAVYQGVDKNTGEAVAVKTFNSSSQLRPTDVQAREFNLLEKVNHENIVKLLAIEQEIDPRGENAHLGKVLVMELCTGGSLFNILDDPENTYGLQEDEFLLVLQHLMGGMQHLRDKGIIHRDLKPGNIMKFIADDGSSIYKLTDFGAARELQDDQQFMSLYGTEEYLHPDMYERAVLRKPVVGKTFAATVDLWSIGVTLYHVATGSLPFRPYGGRRNQQTMHEITTKKEPGVISGVQKSDTGAIEWSRELPPTCQLSYGLKKLVTPLLASLLECDARKMWSYDKFFDEVSRVLAHNVVRVFYVNTMALLKMYIPPNSPNPLAVLSKLLQEQTGLPEDKQLLIYNGHPLKGAIGFLESNGAKLPLDANQSQPVYMLNKSDSTCAMADKFFRPKFPEESRTSTGRVVTPVDVESDAMTAKVHCSVGHCLQRIIEQQSIAHMHTCNSVIALCQTLDFCVRATSYEAEKLDLLMESANTRSNLLLKSAKLYQSLSATALPTTNPETLLSKVQSINGMVSDKQESHVFLENSHEEIMRGIRKLKDDIMVNRFPEGQWKTSETSKNKQLQKCPTMASTYVSSLRESWQRFCRDRHRSMSRYEDQFHNLEKVRLQKSKRQLCLLYEKQCEPAYRHMAKDVSMWLASCYAYLQHIETLWLNISDLNEKLRLHLESLEKVHDMINNLNEDTFALSDYVTVEKHQTVRQQSLESQKVTVELLKSLNSLAADNNEAMQLGEENKSLLGELGSLLSTLNLSMRAELEETVGGLNGPTSH